MGGAVWKRMETIPRSPPARWDQHRPSHIAGFAEESGYSANRPGGERSQGLLMGPQSFPPWRWDWGALTQPLGVLPMIYRRESESWAQGDPGLR